MQDLPRRRTVTTYFARPRTLRNGAYAWDQRTTATCQTPGTAILSTNVPRPTSKFGSSIRLTRAPRNREIVIRDMGIKGYRDKGIIPLSHSFSLGSYDPGSGSPKICSGGFSGPSGALTVDQPRIGVIGTGRHARANIYPAAKLAGAQIAAVCARHLDRAQAAAAEFGAARAYASPAEMLRREALDAVLVIAPEKEQAGLVREVVRACQTVLVERPVGLPECAL